MLEAGALAAGLLVALSGLAALPRRRHGRSAGGWRRLGDGLRARQTALAAAAGIPGLTAERLLLLEAAAGLAGAACGYGLTGLLPLAAAAAAGVPAVLQGVVSIRAEARHRRRQDELLEAVRTLRRLLETGGVGVQQGLQALAARGPGGLRTDFAEIAAAAAAGRQAEAWAAARVRLSDPLFDLLSAAIQLQRPAGGRLGPLFQQVEEAATSMYEVAREARALQVQARSAAVLVVSLPVVFLTVLSALRSPYLDSYHEPVGEVFLAAMLAAIGATYFWIRRLLRLPGEARLEFRDG